jgi:hypothetical protein
MAVPDLLSYLLAFVVGMVAVAALPGRRRPGRDRAAWLAEHRMAVAVWAVGCLLTGTLAALVASLAG